MENMERITLRHAELGPDRRIVAQRGHDCAVCCLTMWRGYLASCDVSGRVLVRETDNGDIVHAFCLPFAAKEMRRVPNALECSDEYDNRVRIGIDNVNEYDDASGDENDARCIPLLDVLTFSKQGRNLRVSGGDEVAEVEIDGDILFAEVDDANRFVTVMTHDKLIFIAEDGQRICGDIVVENKDAFLAAHIYNHGKVLAVTRNGNLMRIDPMKDSVETLVQCRSAITACHFSDDNHVLLGNDVGNIFLFDRSNHKIILKTARKAVDFKHMILVGDAKELVAMKSQSFTLFSSVGRELTVPAPLPSTCACACKGAAKTEIYFSGTNGVIYKINTRKEEITRLCRSEHSLEIIAAGKNTVIGYEPKHSRLVLMRNGKHKLHTLNEKPDAIAVSEDKLIALAFPDRVELRNAENFRLINTATVSQVRHITFSHDQQSLLLVGNRCDLPIFVYDIEKQTLGHLNVDIRYAKFAPVLSIAALPENRLGLLCEGDDLLLVVSRIDCNTGTSEHMYRVVDSGACFEAAVINEDTLCSWHGSKAFRWVDGCKSYTAEDLLRLDSFESLDE